MCREPTVALNIIDAIRNQRAYVLIDDHSAEQVDTTMHAIVAARADVVTE